MLAVSQLPSPELNPDDCTSQLRVNYHPTAWPSIKKCVSELHLVTKVKGGAMNWTAMMNIETNNLFPYAITHLVYVCQDISNVYASVCKVIVLVYIPVDRRPAIHFTSTTSIYTAMRRYNII